MSETVFEREWPFVGGTIALQVRSDRPFPDSPSEYTRITDVCTQLRRIADDLTATWLWKEE